MLKLLEKAESNESIADNIINLMTQADEKNYTNPTKSYRPTISATSNRLYMDALLSTKRFEEYYQLLFYFLSVRVIVLIFYNFN